MKRTWNDLRGAVSIEYLVAVALVAVVSIPAFAAVGEALVTVFGQVRHQLAFPCP